MAVYIPEDGILHRHRCENLKSYIALTGWALLRRRNVSHVRYELAVYIVEDGILHGDRRENLTPYIGTAPTLLPTHYECQSCRCLHVNCDKVSGIRLVLECEIHTQTYGPFVKLNKLF
jgi:hypothetical protein